MEENMILDESMIVEEVNEETHDEVIQEELPKIRPRKKNKNEYKEKMCKVIAYNKHTKTLDIKFDTYGIRIKDVKDFDKCLDFVKIKYKSEIGKPDFVCKL